MCVCVIAWARATSTPRGGGGRGPLLGNHSGRMPPGSPNSDRKMSISVTVFRLDLYFVLINLELKR